MARKERIDMTGVRFERLVGIAFSHKDRHGHCHWVFACDCGKELVAHGGNVRSGSTTSCGCRHSEISAARLRAHGARAGKRHGPTYRAWQAMKGSCSNPSMTGYSRCGGRGIRVDDRWSRDFSAFLADMGERPKGTELRRIDARHNFSPENCRWEAVPSRAERAALAWHERRATPPQPPRTAVVAPGRLRPTHRSTVVSATTEGPRAPFAP